MRVVSLVPSWTETLIEAGVRVVGRTRFCIHPDDKVAEIPIVGGTKEVDWGKVVDVRPDVLVLDQEENPRALAEEAPVPWLATHVTSVWNVARELYRLREGLRQPRLSDIAEHWRGVCDRLARDEREPNWAELPGVREWIRRPGPGVDQFVYLIWRDPWMAVGPRTFISSMFDLLGFGARLARLSELYPQVRLEEFDPRRTLLLLSSEPYPFHDHRPDLEALPFASALVDGESYSWFGVRSLRFLEQCAGQ